MTGPRMKRTGRGSDAGAAVPIGGLMREVLRARGRARAGTHVLSSITPAAPGRLATQALWIGVM